MTFKLQPRDWIPTAEIPKDKRQAVIDAFVKEGATLPDTFWTDWEDAVVAHWDDGDNEFDLFGDDGYDDCRRVTLDQILGEQKTTWDDVGPELLRASIDLRIAQMTYMKHRGCDKYGQDVAYYAAVLDDVIAKAKEIKCT